MVLSLSEEASRIKNQEEPVVQFESKGRKKPVSQFEGSQAGRILSSLEEGQPFCSGHQQIG